MSLFSAIGSYMSGNWGAYGETVSASPDRGAILYWLPVDSRMYLTKWTRREVLRKVEWLLQTFACVRNGLRDVARLSVGDAGIAIQLNTNDEEWNELATEDFGSYALSSSRVDLSGRRNFYELTEELIYQRLRCGEAWAQFAANPRWQNAPCVQLLDSIDIETPTDRMPDPMVIDGVLVDRFTAPISYWVRDMQGGYVQVAAGEMMHWYRPEHINDVRAVSDLAQAVNHLVDAKELIQITTKTAKQNTALGLHIKKMVKAGGQGAFDRLRTLSGTAGDGSGTTTNSIGSIDPQYERLVGGGAVIYTDEAGDAKLLTPNSPTPLLEPFITKVLMRNALSSLGPPSEFFWALESMNGVAQRVILVKTDSVTRKLGSDVSVNFCDPAAVRYLLHRIATGKLRPCRDPNWMEKLEWQLPGRLSIDNGRDARAEIEQLSNGIETLRGINDRRGRSWRRQIQQWFREWKYAQEVAKREGVEWALPSWRAGMPGQSGVSGETEEDGEDVENKEKDESDMDEKA